MGVEVPQKLLKRRWPKTQKHELKAVNKLEPWDWEGHSSLGNNNCGPTGGDLHGNAVKLGLMISCRGKHYWQTPWVQSFKSFGNDSQIQNCFPRTRGPIWSLVSSNHSVFLGGTQETELGVSTMQGMKEEVQRRGWGDWETLQTRRGGTEEGLSCNPLSLSEYLLHKLLLWSCQWDILPLGMEMPEMACPCWVLGLVNCIQYLVHV